MFYVISALSYILLCYYMGDWKNWKRYHATILFFITGDLIYNLFTYNYPLWEYASPILKHTFSGLIMSFIVFPCALMIYIPHYPKTFKMKIMYVALLVMIFSSVEYIAYLLGYFQYYNGWNIWYSVLANIIIVPTMKLHLEKPLLAYLVFGITAIAILICFDVPISILK